MNEESIRETTKHKPWESGQVVVALSRTKTSKQITIVSGMKNRKDIVDALWEYLVRINQWTAMVERTGFIRYEYQKSSSNRSHFHALVGLSRAAMENKELGQRGGQTTLEYSQEIAEHHDASK